MRDYDILDFILTHTLLLIMWPSITQFTFDIIPEHAFVILGTFLCLFEFIQGYLIGNNGENDK